MKTKLSLLFLLSFVFYLGLAQIPQGFNYQAIARDAGGNLITTAFDIKVEIQNLAADTVFWIEEHTVTPNEYGLISFIVGQSGRIGGTVLLFEDIDWASHPRYLKTSANTGSGYTVMGIAQIMSVPYSLVAKEVTGPVENLNIMGTTEDMDEALFEVRNKDGQVIFAVYNEGVRIYVDDTAKGPKGGFAIGSFGTTKEGESQPYFIVKPDTVRIYINQSGKGVKGGFAIGGYGIDKAEPQNFLFVSDDSVRIYIDNADDDYPKGVKGGFAIGGYGLTKGGQKLMTVSDDSVRIYIDDGAKGPKGGFAIGGFDKTKGEGNNANFFNVSTSAQDTIDPSQNRILWYPVKNAFLTGKVLVELPDSVGENSFASGYESKAIGDYSQALGFKAIARSDYSTAIGKNAVADSINSFAFGEDASARNDESYAIGRGAIASGYRSFAFGSAGVDSVGTATDVAKALGAYSFAVGQGSKASGLGSFSFGVASTADEDFSVALGYKNKATAYGSMALGRSSEATGFASTAIGYGSVAQGASSFSAYGIAQGEHSVAIFGKAAGSKSVSIGGLNYLTEALADYSVAIGTGITYTPSIGTPTRASGERAFAIGNGVEASGFGSSAMGYESIASGYYSTAMGVGTKASSAYEMVIGTYNANYTPLSTTDWDTNDRLFVIGKGTGIFQRSNALTVLKNGNVGIGTNSPINKISIAGTRSNTINSANAIAHIGGGDVFTYFGALDGSPSWNTWIQPLRSTDNVPFGLSLCPVGGNVGIGTASPSEKLYVEGNTINNGNLGIGAAGFGGGVKVISIENGTVPTSSLITGILLYAENVFHSPLGYWSELKVRDGFGSVTTLSPHNFSLTEISEPMAWSFYSENHSTGQKINVDMLKAVRLIEQLSGEKLVYIEDFEGNTVDYSSVKYPINEAQCNPYAQDVLESLKKQQQQIESQQGQIEELKAMVEKLMVK